MEVQLNREQVGTVHLKTRVSRYRGVIHMQTALVSHTICLQTRPTFIVPDVAMLLMMSGDSLKACKRLFCTVPVAGAPGSMTSDGCTPQLKPDRPSRNLRTRPDVPHILDLARASRGA